MNIELPTSNSELNKKVNNPGALPHPAIAESDGGSPSSGTK